MTDTRHGDERAALEAARRAASKTTAYAQEWGQTPPETLDEFLRLPFLSKQALIDGARERPPFGDRLGVPVADVAYSFVSPGPLYLPFTANDVQTASEATASSLRCAGFGPEDVVDQVVMYHWVVGGTLADHALRRIGCTVIPAGPGNTELHLESIRTLGVTAIVCFPSFLAHLLARALEQGLELPLRKAGISGEVHEPGFRDRILREHGIVARERYGVGEVGTVAWECEEANGLHLRDDLLFEFIDPETTEPVAMTSPEPKELVVTDPNREAMPVVRYRTGDLVEALEVERCPCGRTSPRLHRIIGRTGAIPRVKGMFVVPKHVGDVLERRGVRTRYQLRIERPGDLDLLTIVLVRPEGGLGDQESLRAELATALRLRADLEEVESLPDDAPLVDDRRALA